MKLMHRSFCLIAVCLLLASVTFAQKSTERSIPSHPMPPIEQVANAATTYAGAYSFTFTMSVRSSIPTTTPIYCDAEISLSDGASTSNPLGRNILESVRAVATRTSATAATCKAVMYYSWSLTTASTDMVMISYTVGTQDTTLATGNVGRTFTSDLGSSTVPVYGSVTSYSIPVRL